MESYAFKAASPAGKVVEGERTVPSRAALIQELHAGGFIPIRIDPLTEGRRLTSLFKLRLDSGKLPQTAIALLLKEMATMLGAGISADRAIALAAKTARTPKLKAALTAVHEKLRSGVAFSVALRQHIPGVPASGLSLIEAGEATGKLADAFESVSISMESQLALQRSLTSALIYPAILFLTTIGAVLFLLTFVVPQFKSVFSDAGASLPLSTQILIGSGEVIEKYGLFILLGLLVAGFVFANWARTPKGREAVDKALLKMPLVGGVVTRFEIARIARTLSSLVIAKVPLARALGFTADGIDNTQIKQSFKAASAKAREGERLGPALAASGQWPVDAIELISIGEEAGRLDIMLGNLADLYEAELQRQTERFLAMLTPIMTLVMGGMVAAIMGAVMSAILGAYDLPS